jgi:DNA transformation protein
VSASPGFATCIAKLLEPFGRGEARRRFGGYGIFRQDPMFVLIADGSLYPKAGGETRVHFQAEGCEPASYDKQDKEYRLSCYPAPEAFLQDDPARMGRTRLAFDAAPRNPARRRSKKS